MIIQYLAGRRTEGHGGGFGGTEGRKKLVGIHILENVRNELYYYFPYLDGAFACISGKGSEADQNHWNRWRFLSFSPEYLLELYVKKPEAVRRGYLHMLLHCLYLHLFRENQEDRRLWNLACDIAVEQIISREKIPVLETGGDAKKIREKVFHILGDGVGFRRKDLPETERTGFSISIWKSWKKPFILMITHSGIPAQEKKGKRQKKNGTGFFPILPQTVRITGNGGEARKGTRRKRQAP